MTMDILAHGLWAAAGAEALHRKTHITKKSMCGIVLLAVLPDVIQVVPILAWLAAGHGSMQSLYDYAVATPGTEPTLPPSVESLVYNLHCATHSAIVAGVVTVLLWFRRRQWLIALLGWWSHMIIDVFTHSKEYYPVPILYPITYRGFDGVAWNTPTFMLVNYLLLAATYGWLWTTRRQHPP